MQSQVRAEIKGKKYRVLGYTENYGVLLYDVEGSLNVCPQVGIVFELEALEDKKRVWGVYIRKVDSSVLYNGSKNQSDLIEEIAKKHFDRRVREDYGGKVLKINGTHGTGSYINIDSLEIENEIAETLKA